MKMKLIVFCATVIFSAAANAQHARIQGGINLANVSVTNNGRVNNANMLTSFQIGVTGDFNLGSILFFQPGVVYTGKGSKTQQGNPNGGFYSKATSNPFYIEIPMNFVFKTPNVSGIRFFGGAGPYLAVGISGKTTIDNNNGVIAQHYEKDIQFSNDDPSTLNYEEGAGFGILKRFDYGLNGTAGIEGRSFTLSANYGLGLAKLQSGSNSSVDNNNKHRVLSFIIGIKL